MNIAWPKNLVANLMANDPCPPAQMPSLSDAVEQARREWLSAQRYYDTVSDKDLVDHAVYLLQAAEKKYMYLLKKARSEGVTHAPYSYCE